MGVTRQTISVEDYIKTIALIGKKTKVVRVTEIGKALNVKAPSVTEALVKLVEAELVRHQKYGGVELTTEGTEIAKDVLRRHEVLRQFLAEILNVSPEIAEQDACGMEHSLSKDSLERLAKFVEFLSNCPLGTPECLRGFSYYFEHGEREQGLLTRCRNRERPK